MDVIKQRLDRRSRTQAAKAEAASSRKHTRASFPSEEIVYRTDSRPVLNGANANHA